MAWRPRLGLVTMVAGRFLLREEPASPTSLWILWIALALAIAGAAAILAGSSILAIPIATVVASLVAVGMVCVRVLMPAVAVAVFGMALGCAALTTVLAVTSGFENELTLRMTRMNGHVLVTKYGLRFTEYPELRERWLADPRVTAVSPFAYAMAAAVPVREDSETNTAEKNTAEKNIAAPARPRRPVLVAVKGLDPAAAGEFAEIRGIFASGELTALRPGDTHHPPGIALGHRLADRLGVTLGDSLSLVLPAEIDGSHDVGPRPPRHATFTVLDRLDTGVTELDKGLALVHLSAAQALFFAKARVTGIELELVDPGLAPSFAETLDHTLPPEFRATSWQQQSASTLAGLRQVRAAVSLVIGLLELVAASALVASLLLLVRRKQPAIAVLMAIGAEARLVFWIFEGIGALAGLLGALVGVALGASYAGLIAAFNYPLQDDVYPIDHLPVALTPWDLLGPAVAAVTICALVTGPVAIFAAKVPVLRGLGRA